MRYFYVTYSAEGATGACTIIATKFMSHKQFKENILIERPNIKNPFILSWIEMTEEDYLVFNEE